MQKVWVVVFITLLHPISVDDQHKGPMIIDQYIDHIKRKEKMIVIDCAILANKKLSKTPLDRYMTGTCEKFGGG